MRGRDYREFVAFAVALVQLACASPSGGADRPLEIVVPTDVATLDPRFSTRSLDIKVNRLVHAGLVGLDPSTLEPVPLVAREWEFDDERTLRVTLRQGVRFHSGRTLEPKDVCATLEALADPALGSPHRAVVRAIGSCVPRGELGVVIHLAEPRATLLSDLEVPVFRTDQVRSPVDLSGRELDGLGPYKVASFGPSEVSLEPADTGVLPKPARAVVVRTVRDENARAMRLLAGRADVAPNAISPAILPALDGREGLRVRARPGANVTYLLFQNDRAPFDRAEARRAVARAIDRESIVRALLAGRGSLAGSVLPPGHWAAPTAARPERFDRAMVMPARSVLGSLPEVSLLTSTDRARITIARSIAQMLGDAGLRVRVSPLDLGVLLARLDSGDFTMATLQMPELTEPNVLKWFFHPEGVPGEGGEGRNRARWRSDEAGRFLDEAASTSDRAIRASAYRNFAALMERDVPVVPLWHEDQVAVVSERAAGFELSAEGRWLAVAALP